MLTTSCPKCEKEVSVPAAANALSRVRCPLCSEEYTLESVFNELPPLLELLDAPAANGAAMSAATVDDTDLEDDSSAGGGMFDFDQRDTGENDAGDIALADPVVEEKPSSSFDFGGDDAAPAATTVGGAATSSRTAARPRKKSASPLKSIIGVIIGGLCAAPIAQFTLWYLPGGWDVEQRDPVNIGRSLPESISKWIVPSWVTNPDGETTTALVDNPPVDPEPTDGSADGDAPEPHEHADGLGSLLGTNHNGNGNGNGNSNGNGGSNDGSAADGGGNNDGVPLFDPLADGTDADAAEPAGNDDPPAADAGVKDAPTYTSAEMGEQLKVVTDEVDRFDQVTDQTLDGGQRLEIRDSFRDAAGRLAELTTFVDNRSEGQGEILDEILSKAGSSAQKRRIIGLTALSVMKDEARETDGIVIAGTVKEIQKRGQLFETVVELTAPQNPPVSVYGTGDPAGAMRDGEIGRAHV